jgi:RNA polymerase sigma-I factor
MSTLSRLHPRFLLSCKREGGCKLQVKSFSELLKNFFSSSRFAVSFKKTAEFHHVAEACEQQSRLEDRRREIIALNQCLSDFGIQISCLVDESPKRSALRKVLIDIGKFLTENQKLMTMLLTEKTLPIQGLLENFKVSRKTLEQNHKFIITIALIYSGPYPCLRDYLRIGSGQ